MPAPHRDLINTPPPPDQPPPLGAVWLVRACVVLWIFGVCGGILFQSPVGVLVVIAAFAAVFITSLWNQWEEHKHITLDGVPRCVACGYDLSGLRSPCSSPPPCPECGNTRRFLSCRACGYDLRGLPGDAPCPECGLSESEALEPGPV